MVKSPIEILKQREKCLEITQYIFVLVFKLDLYGKIICFIESLRRRFLRHFKFGSYFTVYGQGIEQFHTLPLLCTETYSGEGGIGGTCPPWSFERVMSPKDIKKGEKNEESLQKEEENRGKSRNC